MCGGLREGGGAACYLAFKQRLQPSTLLILGKMSIIYRIKSLQRGRTHLWASGTISSLTIEQIPDLIFQNNQEAARRSQKCGSIPLRASNRRMTEPSDGFICLTELAFWTWNQVCLLDKPLLGEGIKRLLNWSTHQCSSSIRRGAAWTRLMEICVSFRSLLFNARSNLRRLKYNKMPLGLLLLSTLSFRGGEGQATACSRSSGPFLTEEQKA